MRTLIIILCIIPTFIFGQNVGIGTNDPNYKLEVDGIIFTTAGIRFPDGSIQTTAAVNGGSGALGSEPPQGMVIQMTGYGGPVSSGSIQQGYNIYAASSGLSSSYNVVGGGGGVSPPSFEKVSITRKVDKSSNNIQYDLARNFHIPQIKVYYLYATGSGVEYSQIETYNDCVFTSYQTGGSSGESIFTESFSFDFREKCVRSYNIDPGAPDHQSFDENCWDRATNTGN